MKDTPRMADEILHVAGESSVSATTAKKEFARLLEMTGRGDVVYITKHDAPRAVLISLERYQSLARSAEQKLEGLRRDFDLMLAEMQSAESRQAMKRAFAADPEELGKAAVASARRGS